MWILLCLLLWCFLSAQIMYLIFAILYLILGIVSLVQLVRSVRLNGFRFAWFIHMEYLVLTGLTIFRAIEMLVYYTWYKNLDVLQQSLIIGIIYVFFPLLFSGVIFSWAGLYSRLTQPRKSAEKKLAKLQTYAASKGGAMGSRRVKSLVAPAPPPPPSRPPSIPAPGGEDHSRVRQSSRMFSQQTSLMSAPNASRTLTKSDIDLEPKKGRAAPPNPLGRSRDTFVALNSVLSLVLFLLVVGMGNSSLDRVESLSRISTIIVIGMLLAFATSLVYYGQGLVKLMKKQSGQQQSQRRAPYAVRLLGAAIGLSFCFVVAAGVLGAELALSSQFTSRAIMFHAIYFSHDIIALVIILLLFAKTVTEERAMMKRKHTARGSRKLNADGTVRVPQDGDDDEDSDDWSDSESESGSGHGYDIDAQLDAIGLAAAAAARHAEQLRAAGGEDSEGSSYDSDTGSDPEGAEISYPPPGSDADLLAKGWVLLNDFELPADLPPGTEIAKVAQLDEFGNRTKLFKRYLRNRAAPIVQPPPGSEPKLLEHGWVMMGELDLPAALLASGVEVAKVEQLDAEGRSFSPAQFKNFVRNRNAPILAPPPGSDAKLIEHGWVMMNEIDVPAAVLAPGMEIAKVEQLDEAGLSFNPAMFKHYKKKCDLPPMDAAALPGSLVDDPTAPTNLSAAARWNAHEWKIMSGMDGPVEVGTFQRRARPAGKGKGDIRRIVKKVQLPTSAAAAAGAAGLTGVAAAAMQKQKEEAAATEHKENASPSADSAASSSSPASSPVFVDDATPAPLLPPPGSDSRLLAHGWILFDQNSADGAVLPAHAELARVEQLDAAGVAFQPPQFKEYMRPRDSSAAAASAAVPVKSEPAGSDRKLLEHGWMVVNDLEAASLPASVEMSRVEQLDAAGRSFEPRRFQRYIKGSDEPLLRRILVQPAQSAPVAPVLLWSRPTPLKTSFESAATLQTSTHYKIQSVDDSDESTVVASEIPVVLLHGSAATESASSTATPSPPTTVPTSPASPPLRPSLLRQSSKLKASPVIQPASPSMLLRPSAAAAGSPSITPASPSLVGSPAFSRRVSRGPMIKADSPMTASPEGPASPSAMQGGRGADGGWTASSPNAVARARPSFNRVPSMDLGPSAAGSALKPEAATPSPPPPVGRMRSVGSSPTAASAAASTVRPGRRGGASGGSRDFDAFGLQAVEEKDSAVSSSSSAAAPAARRTFGGAAALTRAAVSLSHGGAAAADDDVAPAIPVDPTIRWKTIRGFGTTKKEVDVAATEAARRAEGRTGADALWNPRELLRTKITRTVTVEKRSTAARAPNAGQGEQ